MALYVTQFNDVLSHSDEKVKSLLAKLDFQAVEDEECSFSNADHVNRVSRN